MKKAISVLLCLCLVLSVFTVVPFTASAAETTQESVGAKSGATGDCTWTLDDNGALTISGNGAMEDYRITDFDGTYITTAPWGTAIKAVVIEDGVTSIGNFAFYGCTRLTSVTIPDSVTSIGYYAFYNTAWYNNQPDGLIYAGKVAYKYKGTMPDNTSITIKDGTKEIAASAFYICTGLTSVTIPDSVTSIGDSAFSNCTGLTSVTIPNSVTSIGSGAFSVTTWYINQPNGLVYAGKVAYTYKGTMPDNTSIILQDGTKGIAGSAFFGCTGLTSVTIPDSVTSIGDRAFYGCTGLTSVTIPDSVKSIGYDAFDSCTGLTSVHISDIAAWCNIAFSNYYSNPLYYAHNLYLNDVPVTDLIIPDSVTNIGAYAFRNCTGLTSVTIGNSVTSIGDEAFRDCTGLTSVTIPDSVTSIGEAAFSGCTGLTSVTIPNSVTSIGKFAFYGCTGIKSVTIPNSVTSIGDGAFYNCPVKVGLTGNCVWVLGTDCTLTISGNGAMGDYSSKELNGTWITTAPWGANIESVVIEDGVTSIGELAFRGCTRLTSVMIPDSVTSIGGWAFEGCTGLTSVTIPDSVTSISEESFSNCSSNLMFICNPGSIAEEYAIKNGFKTNNQKFLYTILEDGTVEVSAYLDDKTDVVIPATYQGKPVNSLKNWLFVNNSSITSVTLPDSVTRIGKGAFYSCVELKTVTMGNNVTEIGESAFEKCLFIENITLSNQLETIGDEAFYDCRRLKQLNLPNTLTTIGEEAFTNCRSLTELVIPKGVQNLGNEESVGFGMFENCKNLKEITIPESVGYIQDNAFDGCGQVTIRAKVNSYAAQYAAANQLAFSKIDSEPVGDANGDSKINVRDVTSIQRFVGEFVQFTDEQLAAADADGNGIVDINDATYLQMYLAEYDVTLG